MYQALYRKWRPAVFDDVYGQPHITRTLKNELISGRISHAYLFTGSRGTGKTTCAKILSKAVNCPNVKDGNPCCECEICRGIDSGALLDVIEIDAASNNGVDNIRDIREEVNYTPTVCKYRVYIIDEVHMLSTGAFNALLKTLEEPPAHVIFILATTDVQKLPATILSRCQRFDFKRISTDAIVERLNTIATGEGYTITDDACRLIARIADGGMRDAVSLLDRCCMGNSEITVERVNEAAGMAGTAHLFSLASLVAKQDCPGVLETINRLYNESCDIENLCRELIVHFRNLLVAKTVRNFSKLVICPEAEIEELREQSAAFSLSKILECLDILENAAASIKGAANKKTQLEAAAVRMCALKAPSGELVAAPSTGNDELLSRIEELEARINELERNGVTVSVAPAEKTETATVEEKPGPEPEKENSTEPPKPVENKKPEIPVITKQPETKAPTVPAPAVFTPAKTEEKVPQAEKTEKAEKTEASDVKLPDGEFMQWPEVLSALQKKDMPLSMMLAGTKTEIRNGTHLVIYSENSMFYDYISSDRHAIDLMRCVYEVTGAKLRIAIKQTNAEENKTAKSPLEDLKNKINSFNN